MSAQPLSVVASGVSLSAATEKTAIQITSPTNIRNTIKGFTLSFQGVSGTDAPVLIRIVRTTTGGTAGSAPTPVKLKAGTDETVQTAAGINYSAEGTNGDVIMETRCHPQSGIAYYFPLDNLPESAGGGRVALKLTAPQAQTVTATLFFEE